MKKTYRYTWIDVVIAIVAILVLIAILFPAIQADREGSRVRMRCRANLKQLGEAFHVYADQHDGYFPPRFTLNEQDEPQHGWRIILLPYLGETEMYEKIIQFDAKTENDRENLSVVLAKPSVYSCPRTLAEFRKEKRDGVGEAWEKRLTSYQAVFGPNTLLYDSRPRRLFSNDESLSPQVSSSILLAESGTGVHWLETLDLPYSTLFEGVLPIEKGIRGIGSFHANGSHILKVDGSVVFCLKGPLKNGF